MTDLTKSRRAVALRIAEVIDREWPDLAFFAGWDIDEATDIIEPLIPMTAAEAHENLDAYAATARVIHLHLREFCDESLTFDEMIADASRKAGELIHSLREQVTVARESRDASEAHAKEAVQAEMDDKLRKICERLIGNSWDVYLGRKSPRDWQAIADTILLDGRAAAHALLATEAEMADLRKRLADAESKVTELRIACQAFASCLLSVKKHNTDEWMDYASGAFNDLCDVLGTGDRFQYDGREQLRKVK